MYLGEKLADEICRLCELETAEPMFCKCPEVAELKTIRIEKSVLDPHEVIAKSPEDVVGFISTIEGLLGISIKSCVKNRKSSWSKFMEC